MNHLFEITINKYNVIIRLKTFETLPSLVHTYLYAYLKLDFLTFADFKNIEIIIPFANRLLSLVIVDLLCNSMLFGDSYNIENVFPFNTFSDYVSIVCLLIVV